MRIATIKAKRVREGDQVVVTVARVLGMPGRKPHNGAPLMKIEFSDGTAAIIREDESGQVLRDT